MEYVKVYIAVTLYVDEQGKILPLSIIYCGKEYRIDKVTDIRSSPPEHVGGLITKRYDCLFMGKTRSVYREVTGRWFLEVKRDLENE